MRSKAVIFTKPGEVVFRDVDSAEPGPGDLVVKLTHSWISIGTEGSYLRGERINGDTPRRMGDPEPFPLAPGYQSVGVVQRVGSDVTDIITGETVFCVAGKVNGMFQPYGGHVSPMTIERNAVWKLPDDTQPLKYAPLVLAQVGFNCGNRPPIERGDWALVIGDGQVGNWCAQTLKWRGARVAMLGRREARLTLARELTDCHTINSRTEDWHAAVRKLAPQGLGIAVDTVGSAAMTNSVIPLMKRGGHIVSAGFCGTDDLISLQALRDQELSLDSVASLTKERMDATLALIERDVLKTLPLVSHHFPATDAAMAWKAIQEGRSRPPGADADRAVTGVVLDW